MLRFRPCACPPGQMLRVHRSAWMRLLFPSRALYACGQCGSEFLASAAQQAELGQRAQAERMQAPGDPTPDGNAGAPTPAG